MGTVRVREWRMALGRTDKYIIGLWASAANLEQLHQVKELAMNVAADLNFIQVTRLSEKVTEG